MAAGYCAAPTRESARRIAGNRKPGRVWCAVTAGRVAGGPFPAKPGTGYFDQVRSTARVLFFLCSRIAAIPERTATWLPAGFVF
jgi:hypothetical protein